MLLCARCIITYYFRFMNVLDLFILAFLVIGGYYGYKQGLIMAVFNLVAIYAGLYVSVHFSNKISSFFVSSNDGFIVPLLAFVLVLVGAYFLIKFLGGVFERSVKTAWPSGLNNVFGALIGSLKWCFFIGCFFLFVSSVDSSGSFISQETKKKSLLYDFSEGLSEKMIPGVQSTLLFGYESVTKE